MAPRTQISTSERILDAAQEIFLEHGFRSATVRQICGQAGVNVSAIKYHFQDKEGLYLAVLDRLFQETVDKHPLEWEGMAQASTEDRLAHLVRAMLCRILDHDPGDGEQDKWQLIARELTTPSAIMHLLAEKYLRPMKNMAESVIAEMLGLPLDDLRVHDCVASVIGQFAHYLYNRRLIRLLNPGHGVSPADLDRLADHITRFSMAGIREIRAATPQHP